MKNWYAQSFEELISFPALKLSSLDEKVRSALSQEGGLLPESVPNPSIEEEFVHSRTISQSPGNNYKLRVPMERRYYASSSSNKLSPDFIWPPEIQDFNTRFTKTLETIKSRHDPTVTTVAQGVLEWKRSMKARHIGLDIQAWLDRFYMSRIGIRFLIGQRQ